MYSVDTEEEYGGGPIRLLKSGYIIALIIVAIMTAGVHLFLDKIVQEQNNSTIVISIRQTTLVQRAALLAGKYIEGPPELYREELVETANLIRESHSHLLNGSLAMGLEPVTDEEILRIYYSLPYTLDKKVNNFLVQLDMLLLEPAKNLNYQNKSYRYIVNASQGSLANALAASAAKYEAQSIQRIASFQYYQKIALLVIFATLVLEALFIFRPMIARVEFHSRRLKDLALTDGLTELDNGRAFMDKAAKSLQSSNRHGTPLSVCMIDLDHFKLINDKHGHQGGDRALQEFAKLLVHAKRLEDECARLGGEEFVFLLPHTNGREAIILAERLRKATEATPIEIKRNTDVYLTVSIGIAEVNPNALTIDRAMAEADKALYLAKEKGRNRVELSAEYLSEPEYETEDRIIQLPLDNGKKSSS